MTRTTDPDVQILRAALAGQVLDPTDAAYDSARAVMNSAVDRHPALIARCVSADDVSAAISFAHTRDLEISVRGGAHSAAGYCVGDDGLMIDLSRMRHVAVDPLTRRVRVGGGALLADLDAATQAHGLAVPTGVVSHTGIGGLALGGGMGWLSRLHGLTLDNLLSARVVTADGRTLRAAPDEHPDLFWALRGGGGNFGVVTTFEFQAHPVGPTVHFGWFFWGIDQGAEALHMCQKLIDELPREANAIIAGMNSPPAPFVPDAHHFQPGYALLLAGFGTAEQHTAIAARVHRELPPPVEFITSMPYTVLQSLLDEAGDWGQFCYEKGTRISRLSQEAIAVVTTHLARRKSPTSLVEFYPLGGAFSDVDDDDTAFGGGRTPHVEVIINAVARTADLMTTDRTWAHELWRDLQPHAIGIGGYVNTMTESQDDRVRASYGSGKYDRLARVKAAYDPENFFHRNANIKPATPFI